jgi:hypothetical protein
MHRELIKKERYLREKEYTACSLADADGGSDVVKQRRAFQNLHEAKEKYRVFFSGMAYGAAIHEVITTTRGYTTLEAQRR